MRIINIHQANNLLKQGVIFLTILFSSCIATNNIYLNNPISYEKGKGDGYIAIGTGLGAQLDSIRVNGTYESDYKTNIVPVLSVGAQIGLGKQFDLRAAVHLPYVLGGGGFRIGSQYSFLHEGSKFNMALGTDLGFTFSRDSLFNSEIISGARSLFNVDAFLPMSYSFSEDYSIILSPRYSFSWISVDNILYKDKAKFFGLYYPVLTLGFNAKRLYFETSALYTPKKIYPQLGLAFLFN